MSSLWSTGSGMNSKTGSGGSGDDGNVPQHKWTINIGGGRAVMLDMNTCRCGEGNWGSGDDLGIVELVVGEVLCRCRLISLKCPVSPAEGTGSTTGTTEESARARCSSSSLSSSSSSKGSSSSSSVSSSIIEGSSSPSPHHQQDINRILLGVHPP
ncbi:hypothetical protein Tco_0709230 [Tanacetum coccineum]